jgi:hypothetical protein
MELSNKYKVISSYRGKSKFEFWKNLSVGDIVLISFPISKYADISISLSGKATFTCSLAQMSNYLKSIELQQI